MNETMSIKIKRSISFFLTLYAFIGSLWALLLSNYSPGLIASVCVSSIVGLYFDLSYKNDVTNCILIDTINRLDTIDTNNNL